MAVTAPQTSYTQNAVKAIAGLVFGNDPGEKVISKIASETILPGQVVELDPTDSNKCRLPQTASAAGRFLGIAIYSSLRAPGGYTAGQTVDILSRGSIYALFTGTEGSDVGTLLKVSSSSTVATNRGKLTDAATSAGAGTEVYASNIIAIRETGGDVSGLVAVQLGGLLQ